MEKKWQGLLTEPQWREIVKRRVGEVAREEWADEMTAGKKLDVYRELKLEWGYEGKRPFAVLEPARRALGVPMAKTKNKKNYN
jgi:hypothetical protein